MKATYYKEADAMYISLKKGKVNKTRHISEWVLADINKKGEVLGVEILFVSSQLTKKAISSTIRSGKIPVTV
jgi:uncharacterized protein YuzE